LAVTYAVYPSRYFSVLIFPRILGDVVLNAIYKAVACENVSALFTIDFGPNVIDVCMTNML
jgi:hypothetical protein